MAFVPLSYNLRSMHARRSSTLLTIFGIAATVAVLAGLLSVQQGFSTIFQERGSDEVAVMLRPGAGSEGSSGLTRENVDILIKNTPEIATGADGQPLASGELFLAVRRFKYDGGETNVPIRGVQPSTFAVHGDDLEIVEGVRFTPGADEVVVGRRLVDRIRDCRVGDVLRINTTPFRVVGVFGGKGSYESEIWGDVDRLMEALERPVFSRVIARLQPDTDVAALDERLQEGKQVQAEVMTERTYLRNQSGVLSGVIIVLGLFLAVLMGLGAIFTGTNAMLSALAARSHEIGILLSMGFRPWAVFVSFLFEATLLGLLGGIAGCLLVLPLQGIQTGTTNFQTFTEVAFAFRTTFTAMGWSVAFAVLLGVLGGAIPAFKAARLRPTEALRRG